MNADLQSDFDEFWSLVPRREAKKAASRAYEKARKIASKEVIRDGIIRYRDHVATRDSQHVALPASWLNGERWEDEYSAPRPPQPTAREMRLRHELEIARMPVEDDALWRIRIAGYREKKFWSGLWGFPPDDPHCYAPAAILAEFGFRGMQ